MRWLLLSLLFWPLRSPLAVSPVAVVSARPQDVSVPVVYWPEVRTTPRPLRIQVVRIDLASPQVELTALLAPDPDGNGPAEAELVAPERLARQPGVLAAINANAFDALQPNKPGERPRWVERLPVDIIDWATDGQRQASAPSGRYGSFWVNRDGRPQIDVVDAPRAARCAVAGFRRLLVEGRDVTIPPNTVDPRSAIGFDRDGRYVWWVVVDGRQPGFSEGMTLPETAALMAELGCVNALNLDGGGSSILLLNAGRGARLRVMNRPSDGRPRPIPVLLAVRRR